jgi:aspartyl protease family protein
MKRPDCLTLILLIAFASGVAAADISVKVIALFTDKALLQVDGEQKIVRKGETFKGVQLKSASGRGAVVVIEGEEMELGLNRSIAGNFKKPNRSSLRIYADPLGMYYTEGAINGQKTKFLVDTGATFVTLSGRKARSLRIDYRKGIPSTAQTAAAVVRTWQITLDSIEIGGIQASNVEAVVIAGDQPPEVLLGNSFLQHTRLENAGSVLELKQRY